MEQQNHDQMAEQYISAVEKQKQSEGYTPDQSFTRGDMETCYVVGAQESKLLPVGGTGTFGQAVEALKSGFMVAREGWNGKGMWLWLKNETMVKSEWCQDPHLKWIADNNGGEIYAGGCICLKTAQNTIQSGWNPSQPDVLAVDWVLVNPEE